MKIGRIKSVFSRPCLRKSIRRVSLRFVISEMSEKGTASPRIYFHPGLGKVASKYLQHTVFPKFRNIRYIPTNRYYRCVQEIKAGKHDSYLVSREFDNQFEREVRKFAVNFPEACPVLLLRRHDDWIASQYRRFAKNGFTGPFGDFIDPADDRGIFPKENLDFFRRIEILEECFSCPPLVMIYDDLIRDPYGFIDRIAAFCGAEYDKDEIGLEKRHTSYAEKQIRWMQKVNRKLGIHEPEYSRKPLLRYIQRLPYLGYRYAVLYSGLVIPGSWAGSQPLIPEDELRRIRELTRNDWEKCLRYAGHSGNGSEVEGFSTPA